MGANKISLTFRQKIIALVVTAVILAAGIMLGPGTTDLDKLDSLYVRGQYQAALVGLETLLKSDPDSVEILTRLVRTELALGRPVRALEYCLRIASLSSDHSSLIFHEFDRWLQTAEIEKEAAGDILDLIAEELGHFPQWPWLKRLGIQVAIIGHLERLPNYLSHLGDNVYISFRDSIDEGWSKLLESQEWEAAWELAVLLDNFPLQWLPYSGDHREQYMRHFDLGLDAWSMLQERNPQDCLAAVGLAGAMSSKGLDWLQKWEEGNTIPLASAGFYSLWKSYIVRDADSIATSHLENIEAEHLLAAIITQGGIPEKFQVLLDYLKQFPEMAVHLDLALEIESFPQHTRVFPDAQVARLSDDGQSIMYLRDMKWVVHHLATAYELKFDVGDYWHWSPQGSQTLVLRNSPSMGAIYTNQGEVIHEFRWDSHVAWRDSSSLWKTEFRDGDYLVYVEYLETGETSRFQQIDALRSYMFFPGPESRLAWRWGNKIDIWDGNVVKSFGAEGNPQNLSWLPDGSGVLFADNEQLHIQYLDGRKLVLELPGWQQFNPMQPVAWKSPHELYYKCKLGPDFPGILAIYDIKTEAVRLIGILEPYSVAGNRVTASQEGRGVYLYELE